MTWPRVSSHHNMNSLAPEVRENVFLLHAGAEREPSNARLPWGIKIGKRQTDSRTDEIIT